MALSPSLADQATHFHDQSRRTIERLPNTIRSFIADGKLKGYQVGRLIKLNASKVDSFATEIDNS